MDFSSQSPFSVYDAYKGRLGKSNVTFENALMMVRIRYPWNTTTEKICLRKDGERYEM